MMDYGITAREYAAARPIPTIVIAIGAGAVQTAWETEQIYLRGEPRRSSATAFYQLLQTDPATLTLQRLGKPGNELDLSNQSYPQQRRTGLRAAIEHSVSLKNQLLQVLHNQRVHERLIAAGWAEAYEVPLNIFILADLRDPWAAGVCLPLAALLNDGLQNINLCQTHYLLATAVYPDSPVDLDLGVWSTLQSFDEFLRPHSTIRMQLNQALNLSNKSTPDCAVYLFDSRKAGTAEVKDAASLNTLLGNALLALLQGDLARRFFQQRDPDLLYEHGCYYSGIGAAALVYDPQSLQAVCAQRIGAHFFREIIWGVPNDRQAVIGRVQRLQDMLGKLPAWLEALCVPLVPAVGQVTIEPETLEMSALLTDLNLAAFDVEQANQIPWSEQLQHYQSRFEAQILPQVHARLATERDQLQSQLREKLQNALVELPLEVELYPGGITNAREVTALLLAHLVHHKNSASTLVQRIQSRQGELRQHLSERQERMAKLLARAPALPWWLKFFPSGIRRWLAPLYLARYYGPQLYQANRLRDECRDMLQKLCGLQIEEQALSEICQMLPTLEDSLQDMQEALTSFENKLVEASQSYSAVWPPFPLGAGENGWDELFRQAVVNQGLAEWVYTQWQPDLHSWVLDFLKNPAGAGAWREADPQTMGDWVAQKAAEAYQGVWSLDLDDLLERREKESNGIQSTEQQIGICMQAAYPPLRPDFDAAGGTGGSSLSCHALIGNPQWANCQVPTRPDNLQSWQTIYTGDPYLALFIQVRHSIPLISLVDSFCQARSRLEDLPDNQRLEYALPGNLDLGEFPANRDPGPISGDRVDKVFRWKFKPKGSSKEIEQTIELTLSRSRFEYYRRQARLNGRWNCYAELEMPEVRVLAAEFQRIHSQYKWSTFNQACNVLKFVQSCISYSYDQETTGYVDWARYPIETLMEGTGDCEDVAILCAAIIARLGFQVVLLLYPKHVAFGVAGADHLKGDYVVDPLNGMRYFYGEATAAGWHLGQIPEHYRRITPDQILPVTILVTEELDT